MAITNKLEVSGLAVEEVFDQIVNKGISKADASVLVSSWIFENLGKSKRVFNYATDFPAVDPACVAAFIRTFQHADWIDGESTVQAEQTTGEEGFNARFHKIEGDLDAVGRDAAKALVCLAAMRQNLRTLLDEIRAEINRINTDVNNCCNKGTGTGPTVDPLPSFGGLLTAGTFLGVSKFNEKDVSLWKTEQGIMLLPAVQSVGVDVISSNRVQRASTLARFIEETPEVRVTFKEAVTKQQFIDKFGKEVASNGQSIIDLVDILPNSLKFASVDKMVEGVAEREASALRTSEGVSAAIATVFGLDTDVGIGANARVQQMDAIPSKARSVLIRNGIDTVEKLAAATPSKIAEMAKQENIQASSGDIAAWTTLAKTLNQIK